LGEEAWLSLMHPGGVEVDTSVVGETLRTYRAKHSLSQADLAQILHLDQSYISKVENGQRAIRDIHTLLHIATQLDLPPRQLGISDEILRPIPLPSAAPLVGGVDPVQHSQQEWRKLRRALNSGRGDLARVAASLYSPELLATGAPFLAPGAWTPAHLLPLEDITLEWEDTMTPILVTGTEAEACGVLPLRVSGKRYDRYTSAIRYLDPPALFENRPSYRLLDADLAGATPRLRFGLGTYFDKLDLSEAIAHELAGATDRKPEPGWEDLPLRGLVGDPFDLRRRAVMPAIETLTLRRNTKTDQATFFLHWRDPEKVATAAGIHGLIPAGEFQPSTIATWDRENDFDLWRNIVREYSEELLGEPERDGSQGVPLDYESWPLYRGLQAARAAGKVRPFCLGIGLDTLTLTATILTAVVIDDDVFDTLFGDFVSVNAEGILVTASDTTAVTDGLPFDEPCVHRLLTEEPMASPGACILDRAWRHRHQLLGRQAD